MTGPPGLSPCLLSVTAKRLLIWLLLLFLITPVTLIMSAVVKMKAILWTR